MELVREERASLSVGLSLAFQGVGDIVGERGDCKVVSGLLTYLSRSW